ncbi:hypothetical protein ACW9HJ_27005 [Nocardia gipuzkoensis]
MPNYTLDLKSHGGSDIVIGIEFEGTRQGKRLEDLVRRLDRAPTLYTCHASIGRAFDSDLVRVAVDEWVSQIGELRDGVITVLGHCAGGHVATCLAAGISERRGFPVEAVTFDTRPLDHAVLGAEFSEALERSRGFLTESDISLGLHAMRSCRNSIDHDFGHFVSAYTEMISAAADRLNFGKQLRQDIVNGFVDYLEYLTMAVSAQVIPTDLPVRRVCSIDFTNPDPSSLIVDCTSADILVSDPTVTAVNEMLASVLDDD